MSPEELENTAKAIRTFDGTVRKKPIASVSHIFESVAEAYGGCIADFGEDAAAIDIGNGDVILLAADGIWGRLIEKSPWWAGFTSVIVNINDIAAMGGRPLAMVDVVSSSDVETFKEIFTGMAEGVKLFGVPVVGGHTHPEGEKSLSVAIIGIAKKDQLIRSDTAKPGDAVIFAIDLDGRTGPNSPYSFESVSSKTKEEIKKMYEAPRLIGQKQLATAGKDISNPGLIGTLGMLCEVSGAGAEINAGQIIRPDDPEITLERWLLMHPGTGFVFTAAPEKVEECLQVLREGKMTADVCGEMTKERKVILRSGNNTAVVFDFEKEGITGIQKRKRRREPNKKSTPRI
ncbi:MAG: methanogenesis marker 2 protein [Methanimicrococcus sp.]|nr:methanogenesis marker 2 protein [Methanimicrococcus sp.]